MSDDIEASGWDAITQALRALYGDQEPAHWGTVISWQLGGPDPLQGVSAYDAGDHWHYVSYGLTELYEKESDYPEFSGFGFEFSFRLKKDGATAPIWPVSLLQNLARYVFQTGNVLDDGDYMPFNGPIAADQDTVLTGGLFVDDPTLPAVDSPHGRFAFRQLIAVTDDELFAAQRWNTHGVAGLLRDRGAEVADLGRPSFTDDPDFAAALAEGAAREGSRTGISYAGETLSVNQGADVWEITITALVARALAAILPGRIPFGQPYMLASQDEAVLFTPADVAGIRVTEQGLEIGLTAAQAAGLGAAVEPVRGAYTVDGLPLWIHVVPSEIKDSTGRVVAVIGEVPT